MIPEYPDWMTRGEKAAMCDMIVVGARCAGA
jgi:hypothetical protein